MLYRGREEFLGLGKMHQRKVLVSMAEYFPLRHLAHNSGSEPPAPSKDEPIFSIWLDGGYEDNESENQAHGEDCAICLQPQTTRFGHYQVLK